MLWVSHLAAAQWKLQALISALTPLNKAKNTEQVPVILQAAYGPRFPHPAPCKHLIKLCRAGSPQL